MVSEYMAKLLCEPRCKHKWFREIKAVCIKGGWLYVYRCEKCGIVDFKYDNAPSKRELEKDLTEQVDGT